MQIKIEGTKEMEIKINDNSPPKSRDNVIEVMEKIEKILIEKFNAKHLSSEDNNDGAVSLYEIKEPNVIPIRVVLE